MLTIDVEVKASRRLKSGAVIVHESGRLYDSDHGYLRGWGLTGKTVGAKKLSMAQGIIPPGVSANPHYHPFETAIFISKGTCRVFWGTERHEFTDIEEGDFLYIPKGVVHCPANEGKTTVEYVVARSSPEEVCRYPKVKQPVFS